MMRRVWIGGFNGILLATPLILTQSCTQPEEGAADTLYVYRKDTVYQRDTLVIREPISGFDTISIDLFTYFEKYFWRRQYPMDRFDTTRLSEKAFTEAGNARLKNLEGRVISGDALKEPIIVYATEPREFHAQVNIDTFYTWVGNQCTTWVLDTVSSLADSVKCWKNNFIPDSSGAIKTFQFQSRYWPNYPNPTDTVARGFYRWKSWSYMRVDSTTAGRIIIPDIRYVHGKGFEVSDFFSGFEGMDQGLVGRIRIVKLKRRLESRSFKILIISPMTSGMPCPQGGMNSATAIRPAFSSTSIVPEIGSRSRIKEPKFPSMTCSNLNTNIEYRSESKRALHIWAR